jgi:hypothetical protein
MNELIDLLHMTIFTDYKRLSITLGTLLAKQKGAQKLKNYTEKGSTASNENLS